MNTALTLVQARPDLCSEPAGLTATTGLSSEEQNTVQQALAILERHLRQPGAVFGSTAATRDWLRLNLVLPEREVFMVLLLDNQHRLLAHEVLFTGTINHTEVHPREVVKFALQHNAAAAIVAHNHPSGETEPSQADRHITGRLQQALQLVDVRLLDHLIVGGRDTVSLAERGWL